MKRLAMAATAALLVAGQASAASVTVTVTHIHGERGHIRIALCSKTDFLKPHCPWQATAKPTSDTVLVTLTNVPTGQYAVEAFHDENDNAILDRNFFGMPTEGMGFSNDAPMHFGPPGFEAAAFIVSEPKSAAMVLMHYY